MRTNKCITVQKKQMNSDVNKQTNYDTTNQTNLYLHIENRLFVLTYICTYVSF